MAIAYTLLLSLLKSLHLSLWIHTLVRGNRHLTGFIPTLYYFTYDQMHSMLNSWPCIPSDTSVNKEKKKENTTHPSPKNQKKFSSVIVQVLLAGHPASCSMLQIFPNWKTAPVDNTLVKDIYSLWVWQIFWLADMRDLNLDVDCWHSVGINVLGIDGTVLLLVGIIITSIL